MMPVLILGGVSRSPIEKVFKNPSDVQKQVSLGVLLHVFQVGSHDEVLRIGKASFVSVFLPACVVALVGDVALTSPRLKLS